MKVIKPITFVPSMLISSTAVETVADYVPGTPYSKDAEVNYSNSIYVSLQNSNTGHTPGAVGSELWWIKKSANNKYAMFDEYVNTQSISDTPFIVVLRPLKRTNSIALLNISDATVVSIQVQDGFGGDIVYSKSFSLDGTIINDWYDYFFEPYSLKTQIILTDLPPYPDPVITITASAPTSDISIGNCVFGTVYDLGLTQYGVSAGIRDYSTKEANSFGITTFVKRAFSKRMDANMFVDKRTIRQTQKILEELRALPCVWIGAEDEDYDMLTVFGYYRDFNIEITYPSYSLCRLEIEGLI